jgi:hypothetical protein
MITGFHLQITVLPSAEAPVELKVSLEVEDLMFAYQATPAYSDSDLRSMLVVS